MAEQNDKPEKAAAEKASQGGKPVLTPEQEAEAAAKKAARAAGKGKPGKGGAAGAAKTELAAERVKRSQPSRLRKRFESELRTSLMAELGLVNVMQTPAWSRSR